MPRVDLGDYELRERLGTGTVGTIFLAEEKDSGRQVAVKFLSPAVSSNELIVSRFHREMMILEKLDHPNILAYYGGGKHDNQLFFLMEYIPGGTLKELIAQSGTLSWGEAAEVGRQLAAALQHAHNHGIIHRDLKPGNVFVTDAGELKLGDFGIARDTHAQDITEAGLTVGTYSYMAPELVRGERAATGQVDLYALGCLVFELMVGYPPFRGDNFAQIFDQHLNSTPPSVSEHGIACPEKIESLLQELLAKDPNARPFNARTVQGILTHALDPSKDEKVVDEDERAAAQVNSTERQMLSQRVQHPSPDKPDVSWFKLAAIMVALVIVVAIAALLNQ